MKTNRHFVGTLRSILFAVVAAALIAPAAGAQELELPYGVTDRVAPESDAAGAKFGGFTAYPKLNVSAGYDDNILAQEGSLAKDDGRFKVEPSLAYESDWSRNKLSIGGFVGGDLYADYTSQDSLNWGVGGAGQLDVLESSNVQGSVGYQQLTEARGGIISTTTPDPVLYDLLQAGLVGNHRLDQLNLAVSAQFDQYDYDDDSQKYRNRDIWQATAQAGFEFSPGYSGFVRGTFNNRDFENPSITSGNPSQDSDGYNVAVGVSSEITNLISGEAYVGYLDQSYDSAAFKDVSGVSFGANLKWEATKLTSVTVTASREVADSTIPGAGGVLYSIGGFGVSHELTPAISLKGDFAYYDANYEGLPRDDTGYRASAGIDYTLSRMVHLDLTYNFDDRDSNVAGQSYTRNQVTLGVLLQY
ncbi:MAG: outer membrane beta-barrel protein [Myxococcota bacterium]|nr:outer membrane beta-barrel protein [Myxococcota bacterium]